MKLKSYLAKAEIDPAAFADTIGVKPASVYRYMAGDRKPRPAVLERIESATEGNVTPNDFYRTGPVHADAVEAVSA